MEVTEYLPIRVADESASGEVRRIALSLARDLGFSEADVGRVGIVATEAATNLVKHSGDGEIHLRVLRNEAAAGVGLLALDRGPGMDDVSSAMRDGFSSAGSPGTGLGAIRRLSDGFDAYSRPGQGTALVATVWPATGSPSPPAWQIGGVNVPYPGETVSGDAWAVSEAFGRSYVLLSDGLGHGTSAAEASAVAGKVFRGSASRSPADALERIHGALRPTRGAAVAVAEVDPGSSVVRFAGIGNISATIITDGATRSLVSHHGTAGHVARRIEEFTYPWSRESLLVLHSDGLTSRWTFERYPGIAFRDPTIIAGILYRDFRRSRDDASVVVVRGAA
jgi:anti-sigma regulatory factor (Ser/Thr protein kinase)